ncbi:hypothetical protein BDZ94DRAFT_1249839 [Collybia nuda]|uniref:Uncharacterized protein n=1 Tax=Collybia nuda TaxID=64659 RepID=A0A9P5YE46_9AGAR|nr:hypothetical protein BDZ94DRAFT_1249839 [Collybia nuda]
MSAIPDSATGSSSQAQSTPLELYASYPFATDETYQQGLASLIAGGALDGDPPPDIKDEILRRTRVFYFNRVTGNSILMDEARDYELSHRESNDTGAGVISQPMDESTPDETRVLTFAELQELIETGKVDQIPNNKIIPEAINDATPSESKTPARKKPWEVETVEMAE